MENINTIQEGKKYLRENWAKGVECPCCHQFVKLYPRKITGAMALALVVLFKEHTKVGFKEYVHLAQALEKAGYSYQITNTGDKSKLKYWGLIEPMIGERPDGSKKVGKYRITSKGVAFVQGRISIDEKVGLYNQKLWPVENNRQVYIKDVWDNSFDYGEMMNDYLNYDTDSPQRKLL